MCPNVATSRDFGLDLVKALGLPTEDTPVHKITIVCEAGGITEVQIEEFASKEMAANLVALFTTKYAIIRQDEVDEIEHEDYADGDM